MKDIAVDNVRNFALVGHTGSGKTTLIDTILHKLGINDRVGSVDDGSSMADWTEEEKERQHTIWAKPFNGFYTPKSGKKDEFVFTDTPGYVDFYGQVVAATAVSSATMITVDAASGIQVGTNRAWRLCERIHIPRGIVITRLDKENVDFNATLASLQSVWGDHCLPVTIPTSDLSHVVDVLASSEAPDDIAEQFKDVKGKLVEIAAETDDALIEKYLAGENLTPEEIAAGLHESVATGRLIPVFAVSAAKDVGVSELLEGIARLYPSPLDRHIKDADGNEIEPKTDGPFKGLVWRVVNDPFVGQLTIIRVYSGTLKADSEVYNSTRDEKERISQLLILNGKNQEKVSAAHPGDIVAIPKLKHTMINDTLCAPGLSVKLRPIEFPSPVTSYAVYPMHQGDEDKMGTGLHRVADEDPTIKAERNTETHEMILSGMGDVHLDVAIHQMKRISHVELDLRTPKVPYKETITKSGEGHYKHKKQSGGRGQYGEVYLRVEPKAPGEEEWFVNKIVGGSIPGNFIPAVEKGLVEGMQKGAVANYPVVNAKVTVYDGSYHDVDSSEVAFKIAAARAFKAGMAQARPALLEPIVSVKVTVPEQFMGDVTGDLNHKRGRIIGMGSEDGMQVINADVPHAEMFKYSSELRSITGGRGHFEMEFSRYETVPQNIAQKVVAEASKEDEHEKVAK